MGLKEAVKSDPGGFSKSDKSSDLRELILLAEKVYNITEPLYSLVGFLFSQSCLK